MTSDFYVSIIINNYNYESFLSRAIDSCLNQTYSNLEVIVVDDGSTDGSIEILQSYGDKIRAIYQENAGQSSTLNTGFAASKGHIIACLDADDYFLPDKVSEIVSVYEKHPQIGWCFNSLRVVDDTTNSTIGYSIESQSKLCDFRKIIRIGYLPFYPPAASGLSFRRSTLSQILPMPEKIGMYDRYLCWYGLYLSEGYFLDKPLTVRMIHDKNFTRASTQTQLREAGEYGNTKAVVSAALYLRQKCPEMARFCNRRFAAGFGLNWWTKSDISGNTHFIREYFSKISFLEKVYIYIESLYHSRPWRKRLTFRKNYVD